MATVRRSQLADAADQLLRKIDSKLDLYAAQPLMGTPRDSLAPGLRSFPVGKYLIFYRQSPDGIEVARILHGARDLKTLLQNPPQR